MFGSITKRSTRRTGGVHSSVTTAAANSETTTSPTGVASQSYRSNSPEPAPLARKPCSR